LYYLFPSDKKAGRERYRRQIAAATIVGILVCGLMAWVIWYFAGP
jgi:hypothetical protein